QYFFRLISFFRCAVISTYPAWENAATGGIASQSSQWDKFGDANNAIDLNWTNRCLEGSCSRTKAEVDPWWRVDLSKNNNVTYVTITNRGDCCSDRISGAEIHVGDSLFNNGNSNPLCAGIPYIPAGQTRTFPCGGILGRYVTILLPGKEKYLTLCEVEVQASTFQAGMGSIIQNVYLQQMPFLI
uniref:Si:ch73-359m17.2 n=1 Tax=Hucho hucho TaxID=62062 RepID=A0A4W5QKD4_9TELE